jgi:hypothetical protein
MRKDSVTLLPSFSAFLPHVGASMRESWGVLIVMAGRTRTLECQGFPVLSSSINHFKFVLGEGSGNFGCDESWQAFIVATCGFHPRCSSRLTKKMAR